MKQIGRTVKGQYAGPKGAGQPLTVRGRAAPKMGAGGSSGHKPGDPP